MGDKKITDLGRVKLIDPNSFNNQYDGNVGSLYNMSVPTEDLSIMVDLRTIDRNRTILTTSNNNQNQKIETNTNQNGNQIIKLVNFIGGINDGTTGDKRALTTSYTEASSTLHDVEESLGITNIDIEFNSSYAPMVNINFVDIRGGALFQNGAESKFAVLFKLPYPIFQLKIKGYYGKPVTFCLHMTKCNTKFNSQTGNFEINAHFVGYTYAMLSDMLIGYLKAAQETTNGKKMMADLNSGSTKILTINKFIENVSKLDGYTKDKLSADKNDDVKAVMGMPNLISDLNDIISLINTTVASFSQFINPPSAGVGMDNLIIMLQDVILTPWDSNNFDLNTNKLNSLVSTFTNDIKIKINKFNDDIVLNKLDVKFKIDNKLNFNSIKLNLKLLKSGDTSIDSIIGQSYNCSNSPELISNYKKRLSDNINTLASVDKNIIFYDFRDLYDIATKSIDDLNFENTNKTIILNDTISNDLTNKLGMPTDIRSIIKVFTTAIEVFLNQLVDVSKQYNVKKRTDEFTKINLKTLDLNADDIKNKVIYPWPEYHDDKDVEAYLGSTTLDHANVPELKFVDELYQGMITSSKIAADASSLVNNDKPLWNATNPLDSPLASFLIGNSEKNPYERLPSNAKHDDVARLALLRGITFIGFSNTNLTDAEITAFSESEGKLITDRFKDSQDIIKAFNQKYDSVASFAGINGNIDNVDREIVTINSYKNYDYTYIIGSNNPNNSQTYNANYINPDFQLIPIRGNFTGDKFINYFNQINGNIVLDNKISPKQNAANSLNYISLIDSDTYDRNGSNKQSNPIKYANLSVDFSIDKTGKALTDANFLANSGKYGVQEFISIDYGSTTYSTTETSVPFYSLFYDNSVTNDLKNTFITALAKTKTNSTVWDLVSDKSNKSNTIIRLPSDGLPSDFDVNKTNFYDLVYSGFEESATPDQEKKNSIGKNIELFIGYYNKTIGNSDLNYPCVNFSIDNGSVETPYSLFGNLFYYAQNDIGRAFLFLHSMPWIGLTNKNTGILSNQLISNILKFRTGYIQIPDLLPAFIGGLLYRYHYNDIDYAYLYGTKDKGFEKDSITFTFELSGKTLNLLVNGDEITLAIPSTNQYLKTLSNGGKVHPMSFGRTLGGNSYLNLEDELKNLPKLVVNIFVNEFKSYVTGEFQNVKNKFELRPHKGTTEMTDISSWVNKFNDLINLSLDINTIKLSEVTSRIKLANNEDFLNVFDLFTFTNQINPIDGYKSTKYNYFIRYKDGSTQSEYLKGILLKYRYMSNNSYLIWNSVKNYDFKQITISDTNFNTYFKNISVVLSDKVKQIESETTSLSSQAVMNIKFEMYRLLKKIYEKWVTDLSDSKDGANGVLFQCCTKSSGNLSDRISTDTGMMQKTGSVDHPKLIDSFRFIDRSFADIGDKFNINPFVVNKMLLDNTNISFYNFVSRILTDNHFDFIALPNFIDYNDNAELEQVFEPIPYYRASEYTPTGPSFVCVYVGQTSTKLDFGPKHAYPNDGFDLTPITVPKDLAPFASGTTKYAWEDFAAAFVVKYGHQNQNIFKNISLDQAEFGETAESLQITDNIANSTANSMRNYIGQNLFNVYSARSYKTEVEMMGNAMIQPMMYFQLDNIPMFHGAYLITKVKHSIKPNHMSTTFTGTRVKYSTTPIIDAATLSADLLASYGIPTNGATTTGNVAPIVGTIILNGGVNGSINTVSVGNITMSSIILPTGINSNIQNPLDSKLITEAISPLNKMLSDWVTWMISQGFVGKKIGNQTYYASINSAFRTYDEQRNIKNIHSGSGLAATPGRSNHGWGIAIDLQFKKKNGELINNFIGDTPNPDGFKLNINESLRWLLDNSYQYGFLIPAGLREREFWHFEYHGRAAIGILGNRLGIYNESFTINKPLLDIVKNPKNPDGTIPNYVDFTYRHYGGDGTPNVYGGRKIILTTFPNTNMTVIYRNSINSVGSQLGISTGIRQLMEAQAYQEGFKDSTWPLFGCNNPGALEKNSKFNDTSCSAKPRYAYFKDLSTGVAATYNRVHKLILDNNSANYPQGPNTTLFDFITIYAPPIENDDTEYTNMIISYFHLVFKNDTITDKTTLAEINKIV